MTFGQNCDDYLHCAILKVTPTTKSGIRWVKLEVSKGKLTATDPTYIREENIPSRLTLLK